jgi:hypothetical protein
MLAKELNKNKLMKCIIDVSTLSTNYVFIKHLRR